MKKTFVKVLSVAMATVVLLMASMLPVFAASESFSKEYYDSLGNRNYTTMVYTGTQADGITRISVGGTLEMGNTLPNVSSLTGYNGTLYFAAMGIAGYEEETEYRYHFGYRVIDKLEANSGYSVNLVTGDGCSGHIYPDADLTLRITSAHTALTTTLYYMDTNYAVLINQVRQNPKYVVFDE